MECYHGTKNGAIITTLIILVCQEEIMFFSSSYPNFYLLKIALEQSHQVNFGP